MELYFSQTIVEEDGIFHLLLALLIVLYVLNWLLGGSKQANKFAKGCFNNLVRKPLAGILKILHDLIKP